MDESIKEKIRIELLLNAKLYGGKPNGKAVMGKLLGKDPELRSQAKDVKETIDTMIPQIEAMGLDNVASELQKLNPDIEKEYLDHKEEQKQKREEAKKDLPELHNAEMGKVVVRYAPDPSKYPHLGQGMTYIINRIYADKYQGKAILRFDDTNPAKVKPKYYEAIKEGLTWLGCTWDKEVRASQYLSDFYDVAKDWINQNRFYVCECEGDIMKEMRESGKDCEHRKRTVDENLTAFKKMLNNEFQPGEAVVRLVGEMTSDNMVMRDPVMFRLVADKHPLLDKFYPVFPMYDFESAFFETKFGITHVIRSGEFGTMRQELQSHLITLLGGKVPEFVQFGRFNIQGSPTKGRIIRELVEEGIVEGWDDIRLLTLAGLKKRGLHPDTARLIIQEKGLNQGNTVIAWSQLEAKSKELLEPISKRYFFVPDPVNLIVDGSPSKDVKLPLHPDNPKLGDRIQTVNGNFYISREDISDLKVGDIFRLKDLYNVKIVKKTKTKVTGSYEGDKLLSGTKKLQWVNHEALKGKVQVPELLELSKNEINPNSLYEVSGYFEPDIAKISSDDIIQLERFGYAKLYVKNGKVSGHIIHKHF